MTRKEPEPLKAITPKTQVSIGIAASVVLSIVATQVWTEREHDELEEKVKAEVCDTLRRERDLMVGGLGYKLDDITEDVVEIKAAQKDMQKAITENYVMILETNKNIMNMLFEIRDGNKER